MVDKIYFHNESKFPTIANDYREVKSRIDNSDNHSESLILPFEALPQVRRAVSISNKVKNNETVTALGLAGLALINLPEDWRDVKGAAKQIYSKIDKNYHYDPLYNRNTHQHSFSFFRGTAIEKFLHEKMNRGNKIAEKLYDLDKTVYDTKFGEFFKKLFKIERIDAKNVNAIKDFQGKSAKTYQFKSSIYGGEIVARAMKRIPILGVGFLALIEVPKICKEFSKGNNIFEQSNSGAKQTAKSATNIFVTTASIAIGGAIGSKVAGASGSLVGMAVGAIGGSKLSDKIPNSIFS